MHNVETIYLHVGLHKTATTSIQGFLLYNHSKLISDYSLFYPHKGGLANRNGNNYIAFFSAFTNMKRRLNAKSNKKKNKGYRQLKEEEYQVKKQIYDELVSCECKNVIFSSENLSKLSVHELRRIRKFFLQSIDKINIKIVFVGRNPLSFAISDTQQKIKNGCNISRKYILDTYSRIYKSTLKKFIQVFGRDNIISYRYEDSIRSSIGVERYMLEQLGIKTYDNDYYTEYKNKSISLAACDFIHYINKHYPGTEYREKECIFGFRGSEYCIDSVTLHLLAVASKKDIEWLNDQRMSLHYNTIHFEVDKTVELIFNEEYYSNIEKAYSDFSLKIRGYYKEYISSKINAEKNSTYRKILYEIMNDICA